MCALQHELRIRNTLFRFGWVDHEQMDVRRRWCGLQVGGLARGRDVPPEGRSERIKVQINGAWRPWGCHGAAVICIGVRPRSLNVCHGSVCDAGPAEK